jgi:four helix bundle protein
MNFKDLIVWQKSRELAVSVYKLCSELPDNEKFGLVTQLQRASVSIPSNIAEGYRRNNQKEYKQYLGIALGSTAEVETQLILVLDIYEMDTVILQEKSIEVQRMLSTMIRKLS